MDPPVGNGFRLPQQQQQQRVHLINSNSAIIKPSTMSTSKSRKFAKVLTRQHNSNIGSSSSSSCKNNKVSFVTNTPDNSCKTFSFLYPSSPSCLRPQTTRPPQYNSHRRRSLLSSCNLSFIVCFATVVILNNFASFLPTTQATASAQRENTRILPLQTGKCCTTFAMSL